MTIQVSLDGIKLLFLSSHTSDKSPKLLERDKQLLRRIFSESTICFEEQDNEFIVNASEFSDITMLKNVLENKMGLLEYSPLPSFEQIIVNTYELVSQFPTDKSTIPQPQSNKNEDDEISKLRGYSKDLIENINSL